MTDDNTEDKKMSIDSAIEILMTRRRPIILSNQSKYLCLTRKMQILIERMDIAKQALKIAGETEAILYLKEKQNEESLSASMMKNISYYDKLDRGIIPSSSDEPSEDEQSDFLNLRFWLYEESVRRMKAGISEPGLEELFHLPDIEDAKS